MNRVRRRQPVRYVSRSDRHSCSVGSDGEGGHSVDGVGDNTVRRRQRGLLANASKADLFASQRLERVLKLPSVWHYERAHFLHLRERRGVRVCIVQRTHSLTKLHRSVFIPSG